MINYLRVKRLFLLPIIPCLLLALGSVYSPASQLYRYQDEQGNTVLNRTIPPSYVGKGYDVLNEKGRLVERIPAALSKQQISARDEEIARQKQLQVIREQQEKIDNKLKQLYSHPNDAVRILKRRIQDIRGVIQLKKGNIEAAEKESLIQQGRAANLQRNGLSISDTLVRKISSLQNDIASSEADIEKLNAKLHKVHQEFDSKIRRLEIITQKQASDYPALLESLAGKEKPKPAQESPKKIGQ